MKTNKEKHEQFSRMLDKFKNNLHIYSVFTVLRLSIIKWQLGKEKILNYFALSCANNCACCIKHNTCTDCPINKDTNGLGCMNTPFKKFNTNRVYNNNDKKLDPNINDKKIDQNVNEELEYLKSLLKKISKEYGEEVKE